MFSKTAQFHHSTCLPADAKLKKATLANTTSL
jgi:hypothetical protein